MTAADTTSVARVWPAPAVRGAQTRAALSCLTEVKLRASSRTEIRHLLPMCGTSTHYTSAVPNGTFLAPPNQRLQGSPQYLERLLAPAPRREGAAVVPRWEGAVPAKMWRCSSSRMHSPLTLANANASTSASASNMRTRRLTQAQSTTASACSSSATARGWSSYATSTRTIGRQLHKRNCTLGTCGAGWPSSLVCGTTRSLSKPRGCSRPPGDPTP